MALTQQEKEVALKHLAALAASELPTVVENVQAQKEKAPEKGFLVRLKDTTVDMFTSKKFLVMLGTAAFNVFSDRFGMTSDQSALVTGAAATYLLGQGVADANSLRRNKAETDYVKPNLAEFGIKF